MFPTGVGMNRDKAHSGGVYDHVPHGCGDEPYKEDMAAVKRICSPRVWG